MKTSAPLTSWVTALLRTVLRSVAPGGYLNTGAAQAAVTALAAMQAGAL